MDEEENSASSEGSEEGEQIDKKSEPEDVPKMAEDIEKKDGKSITSSSLTPYSVHPR